VVIEPKNQIQIIYYISCYFDFKEIEKRNEPEQELFPIRRTLPLATAIEFTNGRESSLVCITPFLMIKSATNGEEECGSSFFHVRKSAKPTNGF
jgi:hypothetical protein